MTRVLSGLRSTRRFRSMCLIGVIAVLSSFLQSDFAAQFDREGAQHALEEARKLRALLTQDPQSGPESYLRCIRKYKSVYALDPHYGGSDDAIYEAGLLYQEMGEKFASTEYYKDAVKQFSFLLSDYGASPHRPDAFQRIAFLSQGPLGGAETGLEAFERYRTRTSKEARPAAIDIPDDKKATDAKQQIPPPENDRKVANDPIVFVRGIRSWSMKEYTRVVIDMTKETGFTKTEIENPDRIFFDISGAKIERDMQNKEYPVGDDLLERVRIAQNRKDVVRVVLDVASSRDYTVFELHNPYRIVIDLLGKRTGPERVAVTPESTPRADELGSATAASRTASSSPKAAAVSSESLAARSKADAAKPSPGKTKLEVAELSPAVKAADTSDTKSSRAKTAPSQPEGRAAIAMQTRVSTDSGPTPARELERTSAAHADSQPAPRAAEAKPQSSKPAEKPNVAPRRDAKSSTAADPDKSAVSIDQKKEGKQIASALPTIQAPAATAQQPDVKTASTGADTGSSITANQAAPTADPKAITENAAQPTEPAAPATLPKPASPTSRGDRTLTRMLGLKIGRIVIDPGHGGHDTGTVGRDGLMEKDLALNVARELRRLLAEKLGAEVILTREDDSFVSLEQRTAIANQNQADLFISIHANSSSSKSISGVETYFLDFARTASAREVAARENATTVQNVRDLQDLIRQIAQADKSAESREFAASIQRNLYGGARRLIPATRDRGVRSAPFVVLIGADMPAVLAEIAFISNPRDERLLKKEDSPEKLANALFKGIEGYMKTLGSDVAQNHSKSD